MGFRTTMTTEAYAGIKIPQWFKDKYTCFNYGIDDVFPITLKYETKFYAKLSEDERLLDIQKILKDDNFTGSTSVVLLHECGGVTLVFITTDSILAREPLTWKEVESVEHDYCYDCSKPQRP